MKKMVVSVCLLDFNLSFIAQRVNNIFIIYTIYYFLLHFLHLSGLKFVFTVDLQKQSIVI